jgi:hypothetical protein
MYRRLENNMRRAIVLRAKGIELISRSFLQAAYARC